MRTASIRCPELDLLPCEGIRAAALPARAQDSGLKILHGPNMRVRGQKNVYYIDLGKGVCCGYIETSITREPHESRVVYECRYQQVESIAVLNDDGAPLSVDFACRAGSCGTVQILCGSEATGAVAGENKKSSAEPALDAATDGQPAAEATEPPKEEADPQPSSGFAIELPGSFSEEKFVLRVAFRATADNPDLRWYRPVDAGDRHREVVGFGACPFDAPGGASALAPYIGVATQFELIYVVPNKEDVRVASSGALYAIKEEDQNIVHSYRVFAHPAHLVFSVGTYEQTDIFADSDARRILSPAGTEDLADVQSDLQGTVRCIESFTRTDALRALTVVFTMVDFSVVRSAPDVIILGAARIPGPTAVEPAYDFKQTLCDALSYNVYGFLRWDAFDSWIKHGLAGYLSDHAYRSILGMNEFLSNYKQDRDYVLDNDVYEPPLFYTQRPAVDYQSRFFRTKSKLVFHCLEAQLSLAFLQKISDEVVGAKKQGASSLGSSVAQGSASPGQPTLFTPQFIKIIKDATGKDMSLFFDMYVFCPGLLRVKLALQINRKKNTVRVTPSVLPTSRLQGCNTHYSGAILLKTSEIEGAFDHDASLDAETTFFYHTRAKKKKKEDEEEVMPLLFVRADPKREYLFDIAVEQPDYMHMEQLSEKNVLGQLEAIDALRGKPTVLSCEALERVLDNTHVFYKVRVKILYVLREVAIEGYNGLQRLIQYFVRTRCVPNSTVIKANEFGLVNYFVQKHLVRAIASFAAPPGSVFAGRSSAGEGLGMAAGSAGSGIDQLLKGGTAKERYGATGAAAALPKLVQDCRMVVAFLTNILKFNDNSLSTFDDSWYLATVINCLSSQMVLLHQCGALEPRALEDCLSEMERFRILDMLFPSSNNIISQSCLISLLRLAYNGLITLDKGILLSLCGYPNHPSIRLVAIEGLLILYEDAALDVLGSIQTDTVYFQLRVFELIARLLSMDLCSFYRAKDSAAGSATLGEVRMRLDSFRELHACHPPMRHLLGNILQFLEGHGISIAAFKESVVSNFSLAEEEGIRRTMLHITRTHRAVRVVGFDELRLGLLSQLGRIRLPRCARIVIKLQNKSSPQIRLPYSSYVTKNINATVFRFKVSTKPIQYRRADIPTLLISKIRGHHSVSYVEEFLKSAKLVGFFDWQPATLGSIQEALLVRPSCTMAPPVPAVYLHPHSEQAAVLRSLNDPNSLSQVYRRIEKALVYALSYTEFKSKIYYAAKVIFNLLERTAFQHAYIEAAVIPMSDQLRAECYALVDSLIADGRFVAFVEPVNCAELKTYPDIVRFPVSLSEVRANLSFYCSYNSFILELDRVHQNCLNFNNVASDIAKAAIALRGLVDAFKGRIVSAQNELELVDSYKVLESIISSVDDAGCFSGLLASLKSLRAWGDIDNELLEIKRKYSRNASDAKAYLGGIKEIRRQIRYWFSVDSGRVLGVCE
ncbi:transcription initiation factor TFIID subunit 2 [Pancytospora philotis]|nr:transcription initiation factor TFIID subunit 2 [Pancytospora philotis]